MNEIEHVCISAGNTKMGTIKSVSLPAIVTCRKCDCNKLCYATRGRFSFGVVHESLERNLRILKSDPNRFWKEVNGAVAGSDYFRFHVSGDIPNREYFENMVKVARANKSTQILVFTKKYELVNKYIEDGHRLPSNLHLMFSKWRGLEMPNPHKLPEVHVFFSDGTTTAKPTAKPCTGHCMNCATKCAGCFGLKRGEQLVIVEH